MKKHIGMVRASQSFVGYNYLEFCRSPLMCFLLLAYFIQIAGGSGITPMLQVIEAILKNPDDTTKVSLTTVFFTIPYLAHMCDCHFFMVNPMKLLTLPS